MQTDSHFKTGSHLPFAALHSPRAQWVDAFSNTLLGLSPQQGEVRTRRLACDLWAELHHFDPVMAAEMEFESSLCDA